MSTILNSDKSYQIETKVGAGSIEDPVTGERHEINSYEDERGGTIEVERPDSAKYIVDSSGQFSFASKAPSAKAVKKAQKDALEMETVPDHILAFAKGQPTPLGEQVLDVSKGFDPETDDAYNGPRMKAVKMYDRLQSEGYTDEARYLRLLGNLNYQEEFADYVREEFDL
ncbi:hypothetical protein [Halorhabdus sp. CUG00001]|uniref:hypothetical protein n=1 Tax=Halorhabdus sp. CUG00001 TaxID=2600297 RepID=UPI00131E335F|nr:hypothetical protein [Halorhabdus sp. CUG00001]